jgi:release factor glutamine methyltransferase
VPEIALRLAQKAAQLFAERGIENARLESELLLAHVLGIKRLELYLQFERPLTEGELETFRSFVRRRLKREPLQYILGKVQFRHVDLAVDRRVLIPRPETEVLAGVVVDYIGDRAARVIDIGTGSGAIALSVMKECPNATVFATDISRGAAEVAESNGVHVSIGDVFASVEGEFDVVVSNPPYISESERDSLQPEVKDWEPQEALFAGNNGLSVIDRLIARSPDRLIAQGLLALEVGSTQAAAVAAMIDATGKFEKVEVIRDLAGRERIVKAVRTYDD